MAHIDDVLSILKEDLLELGTQYGKEISNSLFKDGTRFIESAGEDLKRWTTQLASGQITPADYKWLLESKKDLATMEALKQQGLTQAKIDACRTAMLESIIGSAFKLVGI